MPIRLRRPPERSLDDILRLVSDLPAQDSSAAVAELLARTDQQPDKPEPEPPFLSLKEAADWLGVSMSTLNRLLRRGALAAVRVAARRKVPSNYLAAYLARDIITPSQVIDLAHSLSVVPEHIQNTEE